MSEASIREEALREQYTELGQQRDADTLGMWIFLSTETLLFGGLFASYTIYRLAFGAAFQAAGAHMHIWLGTVNTAVLLTSSLTMALAVVASRARSRPWNLFLLLATAALGALFLGLKFYEWYKEREEGLMSVRGMGFHFSGAQPEHVQMFFNLYYVLTGLHAVHLTIGVCIVLVMAFFAAVPHNPVRHEYRMEIAGLYWALIDVIWTFIFPLFYLVNPHG